MNTDYQNISLSSGLAVSLVSLTFSVVSASFFAASLISVADCIAWILLQQFDSAISSLLLSIALIHFSRVQCYKLMAEVIDFSITYQQFAKNAIARFRRFNKML